MARLRGTVMPSILLHVDEDPRPYDDAITEAFDQCVNLGLDPNPTGEFDASDLIRYAYAQGWASCEKRIACPDMADAIDQAIQDPASQLERDGATDRGWAVRAVQKTVAYGVSSGPH